MEDSTDPNSALGNDCSVKIEQSAESHNARLMQMPAELLMKVLGFLDSEFIRFVVQLVNKRFCRLSSDYTLNCRVKVPQYWPLDRVPALLSTPPLQQHLKELELRYTDEVHQLYEGLHHRRITLASLTSIICGICPLASTSELELDVFSSVTPRLQEIKIKNDGRCNLSDFQRLFTAVSIVKSLLKAFPNVNMYVDFRIWMNELTPSMFDIFELRRGQLHGFLEIYSSDEKFTVPIDAFLQCGLIDLFGSCKKLFNTSVRRNATSVAIATRTNSLPQAMFGLQHASAVRFEVSSTDSMEVLKYASDTTLQLKSLDITCLDDDLHTINSMYYHGIIVNHCSSLVDLQLRGCSLSPLLLSVLPASLRHLKLHACGYEVGDCDKQAGLDLLSLDVSLVDRAVVVAIENLLLPQSRITRLCHEDDCCDDTVLASVLERCPLLSSLSASYNYPNPDVLLSFPLSLEYVAIDFEIHSISELETTVEVLDRLIMYPGLKELAIGLPYDYLNVEWDMFETKVQGILKKAIRQSDSLEKLQFTHHKTHVDLEGDFEDALSMEQSTVDMIEATLAQQSRPYLIQDYTDNTYNMHTYKTYIIVPKQLS